MYRPRRRPRPPILMQRMIMAVSQMTRHSSRLSIPIHEVLHAQKRVTASLEDSTELEGPWDLGGCREEPEHLHRVAGEPAREHGQPEAFA